MGLYNVKGCVSIEQVIYEVRNYGEIAEGYMNDISEGIEPLKEVVSRTMELKNKLKKEYDNNNKIVIQKKHENDLVFATYSGAIEDMYVYLGEIGVGNCYDKLYDINNYSNIHLCDLENIMGEK